LARVGARYSDEWHVDHLTNPRSVVPESIMPTYGFLNNAKLDAGSIEAVLVANRRVGVPYSDEMIENAAADFEAQADPDADWEDMVARYPKAQVRNFDGQPELTEMDALVAYLQMLGTLVDFSTFQPEASR
jgi:cytochrome c oxidase cbb3-type subunit 2